MSPNLRSRRSVLAAGVGLGGLGLAGTAVLQFGADSDPPGPQGFSAMLVPAGSDPLVMAHIDSVLQSDLSKNVLSTVLGARQFADLPAALSHAFERTAEATVDIHSVGTMIIVGSEIAADAGGAIVWADWTAEDILTVLESAGDTDVQSESYRGQTVYTTGETSAAKVGDTLFTFGTPTVVRYLIINAVDNNVTPIGGRTLRAFARTPLYAHVRFSFETLRLPCDTPSTSVTNSSVYDGIVQGYGSVPESGDELRLHLRVDPLADRRAIATAVRDDLDTVDRDFVDDIDVTDDHDVVTLRYTQNPDENAAVVGDVIETVVCRSGLAR